MRLVALIASPSTVDVNVVVVGNVVGNGDGDDSFHHLDADSTEMREWRRNPLFESFTSPSPSTTTTTSKST